MSVKIRLQRRGRKKRPFYHIVVADARAPRDGRFIEKLGTYNPLTTPATIELDRDKAYDWLMKGAQPTYTTRAILRFKGVYYKKHLMRGVKKGALTLEEAEAKYQEWVNAKDAKIAARFEKAQAEHKARLAEISGITAESIAAATEEMENVAAEATEAVEGAPVEEAPVADQPEAVAEEKAASEEEE